MKITEHTQEIKEVEKMIFTACEVADLLGVAAQQVTNWTVARPFTINNILKRGKKAGNRNLYDVKDVLRFMVAQKLWKLGLRGSAIQIIMDHPNTQRDRIWGIYHLGIVTSSVIQTLPARTDLILEVNPPGDWWDAPAYIRVEVKEMKKELLSRVLSRLI